IGGEFAPQGLGRNKLWPDAPSSRRNPLFDPVNLVVSLRPAKWEGRRTSDEVDTMRKDGGTCRRGDRDFRHFFRAESSGIYQARAVERRAVQARQWAGAPCGLPSCTSYGELFEPYRLPRIVRARLPYTLFQHQIPEQRGIGQVGTNAARRKGSGGFRAQPVRDHKGDSVRPQRRRTPDELLSSGGGER